MITVLIAALVLMGLALGICLYAASKAPVGFEDERGFHYGPETPAPPHEVHGAVPVLSR